MKKKKDYFIYSGQKTELLLVNLGESFPAVEVKPLEWVLDVEYCANNVGNKGDDRDVDEDDEANDEFVDLRLLTTIVWLLFKSVALFEFA